MATSPFGLADNCWCKDEQQHFVTGSRCGILLWQIARATQIGRGKEIKPTIIIFLVAINIDMDMFVGLG
jgi:hypothetical protein